VRIERHCSAPGLLQRMHAYVARATSLNPIQSTANEQQAPGNPRRGNMAARSSAPAPPWNSTGHITVGESFQAARDALAADFGVQCTADNAAAIEPASVIVVAVKPQAAGTVLAPLQPALQRTRPVVISIAAGIRLAALEYWCGAGVPVIRAMPNRPALVGAGAAGLFAPASVAVRTAKPPSKSCRRFGEVIWVATKTISTS